MLPQLLLLLLKLRAVVVQYCWKLRYYYLDQSPGFAADCYSITSLEAAVAPEAA
jgi:hypothetical protein